MKFSVYVESDRIKPDGPIEEYKKLGFTFHPTQLEDGSFQIED